MYYKKNGIIHVTIKFDFNLQKCIEKSGSLYRCPLSGISTPSSIEKFCIIQVTGGISTPSSTENFIIIVIVLKTPKEQWNGTEKKRC